MLWCYHKVNNNNNYALPFIINIRPLAVITCNIINFKLLSTLHLFFSRFSRYVSCQTNAVDLTATQTTLNKSRLSCRDNIK